MHPRWLYVLPNGDVLVAETNTPPQPEQTGVMAWVTRMVMGWAGAGVPSPNRIILLRDSDGDGVAETKSAFLSGLNSPFGMALVGNDLYVADTDAVLRFPYREGDTAITAPGTKLADLPAGDYNYHWTKNIIASGDGSKLFAAIGSNSNAGENGMAVEQGRAAIVDDRSRDRRDAPLRLRPAQSGRARLRAATSGALWVAVNERDELGNDLVPDYMTAVKEGGFYGWPYSYYGDHLDPRVSPQRPDLVAKAIVPDYALGPAHRLARTRLLRRRAVARPLSRRRLYRPARLVEPRSAQRLQGHLRAVRRMAARRVRRRTCSPAFSTMTGDARGRPVGVAVDKAGALLVADDVGNTIWRVTPTALQSTAPKP